MSADDAFRASAHDLKRRLKRAAKARAAGAPDEDAQSINLAVRRNIVAATNVGEDGATQVASSTQTTHIRQRNGETVDEV